MTTTDTTLQGNKANNSNTNSPDGNTDMPDIYKDFDFETLVLREFENV